MNRRTMLLGTIGAAVGAALPKPEANPAEWQTYINDDLEPMQIQSLTGYSQTTWYPPSDEIGVVFVEGSGS